MAKVTITIEDQPGGLATATMSSEPSMPEKESERTIAQRAAVDALPHVFQQLAFSLVPADRPSPEPGKNGTH